MEIPIAGNNFGVDLNFKYENTGNSGKVTGWLSVLGFKAVDITISYSTNTGKTINPPNTAAGNTLDPTDYYDRLILLEELTAWIESIGFSLDDVFNLESIFNF
jgi:hypothetical protein